MAHPTPSDTDGLAALWAGSGEMGARMQALDWSRTTLGSPDTWPQGLRSAVSICLHSRYPIAIYWSSDLVLLYNDDWSPILGEKHPWALGRAGREVWPEIWDRISPLFQRVMAKGEGVWQQDELLPMRRHGYTEECYFNFTFSPILDETGAVGGVFNAVVETTYRVIGERRMQTLRQLAERTSAAKAMEEVWAAAAATLEAAAADVPFALLYALDDGGATARLKRAVGFDAGTAVSPAEVPLGSPSADGDVWRLAEVAGSGSAVRIDDLSEWVDILPRGPWDEPSVSALVLPIAGAGEERPFGILVAGVSPRRALDDEYRGFFELLAGQLGTVASNARSYEAARRRAEALAELDRAKTTFFSNISHEFRTPLTLQLGPLEDALRDQADPLPPSQRERVAVAHRNGLRLLKLVNSLLDFSRIEAGRAQAAYEATDLAALTADLASTFRSAIERAGLAYVVDCSPLGEPAYVDRDMWEKIVLNLLSNAFKFTRAGEIRVSLRRGGGNALLEVADTGTGIPAAELPHLFERFHRVRNPGARTQEGTGIGLALVHELVRLHRGDVTVQSEEGRGSTFRVTLPLGMEHLPSAAVAAERSLAATALGAAPFVEEALRWDGGQPPGSDAVTPSTGLATTRPDAVAAEIDVWRGSEATGDARILLADDNADMRAYVERLLGAYWSVEAVGDGLTALARARADRPDLVLSDVMMPGLDGFELLAALRADPGTREIPVILLSARAGEEARAEGLDAGADDYLVKPFSARELLARVSGTLRLARLRAAATAALSQSETRYRGLAEATSQVIWTADGAGVSDVSQSWERYTGQRWPDYRGLGALDAVHPDERAGIAAAWARAIAEPAPFELAFRLRRADGSYRRVISRGVPMPADDGTVRGWIGTISDVDDQWVAEERLRQAAKMEAIGRLAGGIAHDFNNQLQGVSGFARFVEREPGLSPNARADIGEIQKAAERMASLTRQLLAFSRQQVLAPETLELNAAIADARPLLQRLLGPEIVVDVDASKTPLWIQVDRTQLLQVLMNLAINARDAMPAGGNLTMRTAVSAERGGGAGTGATGAGAHEGYATLVVEDTGVGIAPEALPHIFEPFFTTKEVGQGTGLGLATVHGIVVQSRGHIEVESTPGAGTRFTVLLPLVARPPAAASAGSQSPTVPVRGVRVLVVDDEAVVRSILQRMLEAEGYEVVAVADGRVAMRYLESVSGDVDLVLSDVVMPNMGGAELGQMLATTYPALPVAWISGYPRDAAFRDRPGREHQPFLQKPIAPEELRAVVRGAVRRRLASRP